MSQAPSRRRWYQFGIGTMLVTIALFALWLGWEMHKVRERDRLIRSPEFLRLLEYRFSARQLSDRKSWEAIRRNIEGKVAAGPPPSDTIPYVWRLVGDKPIENMDIFLPGDKYSARDARRIQRLFPECAVTVVPFRPQPEDAELSDIITEQLKRELTAPPSRSPSISK